MVTESIVSSTARYSSYHLIIIRDGGADMWITESGGGPTLPVATIPRHGRLAHDLTQVVKDKWGITSLCLFGAHSSDSSDHDVQVLEAFSSSQSVSGGGRWLPSADAITLLRPSQAAILEIALQECKSRAAGHEDNLFTKPGWMHDLLAWVVECVKPLNLRLSGSWTQFGAGPGYALLRFEAEKTAVWFKSSGPNAREFNVMTTLVPRARQFFPVVVASRSDWRAWLMLEQAGMTLDNVSECDHWLNAASALGELQSAFFDSDDLLLGAECIDWRAERVFRTLDPFFESMRDIMAKQPPNSRATPLSANQLRSLAEQVRRLCERFYSLRAPSSLNNVDFNPTNAISAPEATIFIDWAAATIAHPLVTFEFLLANLALVQPSLRCSADAIRHSYTLAVQGGGHFSKIEEQLVFSPVVAACIYAMNCWVAAEHLRTARWDPLLRSMIRRIHRELDSVAIRGLR